MPYRVTNTAKDGPRGVNTLDGPTIYVAPGETSTPLEIAEHEVKAMQDHAPWFTLEATDDAPVTAAPPHPDDASRIVNPTLSNDDIARRALESGGTDEPRELATPVKPNFDAMSDDALRGYLTDAEVSFHPATGHEKLVAKASETFDALAAQAAEAGETEAPGEIV